MRKVVAVVGQGYVGLPLSILLANSGFKVIGIDNNLNLVKELNKGITHIEDIDSENLKFLLQNGSYKAVTEPSKVKSAEVIIVCVPTPLNSKKQPDLSSLLSGVESVSNHLINDALIIIESTVEPGTTRKIVKPLIEKVTEPKRLNIHIALSPERVDPKNLKWNISNTPKLISGLTEESLTLAVKFYSKFINNIIRCSTVEVAEAAKLLENSFRLVNISFINEFFVFCNLMKIDVNEVIDAAATKPYGFMPFYPGLGAGGHCIPVDPVYLANKSRELGAPTRFIDLADQINEEMPEYFVGRAEAMLGGLKSKKILVVGVSYKPNVADVRETPVEALISGLKQKGAKVFWHDDLVKEWNGENSTALSNQYDLAILATPHDYLDLKRLGDIPTLDTRRSV